MKNQQSFSHGLLYSMAPENLCALHLRDEDGHDEFDWGAYESRLAGHSFVRVVLKFIAKGYLVFSLKFCSKNVKIES